MTSQDTLAERYGAPSPWRRTALLAGAGVVVAAFLVWLGWVTLGAAQPAVDSDLVAFEIDDHAVTAVVDIEFADDSVVATCLLRAFAEDHTVVGELSWTPDPAAGGRFEETVRTERRATAVESVGCTTEDQSRPR